MIWAIYSLLGISIVVFFWQRIHYKKQVEQWKKKVSSLEGAISEKENSAHGLKNEFDDKRNKYFEKLSVAFHSGGDIIQQTTNNFQLSEKLFYKNIQSIDAITKSTDEVKKCTIRSKDSVVELEVNTKNLKAVNEDHAQIIKMLKDVQDKCKKINDIAFQAHLLSFNAAIEAAQAGEHGKGFAVVAEDIGEMAALSKESSDEITKTVNESVSLMLKISNNVEDNIEKTLSSTELVINEFSNVDVYMKDVLTTVDGVNLHAETATQQIKDMGTDSKTELENLNKILSDVIGVVTENEIVDIEPIVALDTIGDYVVIDVRGYDEWNDELGHITSAQHICLQDRFKEQLKNLDKDDCYLFVCRSGGRSSRAARIAQALGFSSVYNLEGGMLKWKELGLLSTWDKQAAA